MNWFERYGIVGAYFLVITLFYSIVFSLFPISIQILKDIGPLFAIAFLPIGYVISVISQVLYYTRFGGKQIHKEIAKLLDPILDEREKKLFQLSKNDDEAVIEANLTSLLRLKKISGIELKSLKYLAKFVTRRFDVIAINNSIILATILSFFIMLVMAITRFCFKSNILLNHLYLLCIIILSFSIIIILRKSNKILGEQIVEVNKHLFHLSDIDKNGKEIMKNKIQKFWLWCVKLIIKLWNCIDKNKELIMLAAATLALVVAVFTLKESEKQGRLTNILAINNLYVYSLPFYGTSETYIMLKKTINEVEDEQIKNLINKNIQALIDRYLEQRTVITEYSRDKIPCYESESGQKCGKGAPLNDLFNYLENHQNMVIAGACSAWILGHDKNLSEVEKKKVLEELKRSIENDSFLVIKYIAAESYKDLTPELRWSEDIDLLDYTEVLGFINRKSNTYSQ